MDVAVLEDRVLFSAAPLQIDAAFAANEIPQSVDTNSQTDDGLQVAFSSLQEGPRLVVLDSDLDDVQRFLDDM